MRTLIAILACLSATNALAAEEGSTTPATQPAPMHRYLIQRTFPKGALEGIDATAKAHVNAVNAQYNVHWVMSYENPEKTRTYCIYDGPNEESVRAAAKANNQPVDSVVEVSNTILPY